MCRCAACTEPPRSASFSPTTPAPRTSRSRPDRSAGRFPALMSKCNGRTVAAVDPDELGEIKVRRHDAWFPTKDRGRIDADGYFYHAGRADDVIISAGWTMSAVEIEDALLAHPAVQAAAVIGVPDALRGLVVKAFVVPAPGYASDARRCQPTFRRFVRDAAQPARISAPHQLRRRPAADAGRERSIARPCATRKPPRPDQTEQA